MAKKYAYKVEVETTTHYGNTLYYYEDDFGSFDKALILLNSYARHYGLYNITTEKVIKAVKVQGSFEASKTRWADVVFVKITAVKI